MLSHQNRILFRRWAAGDREAVEAEVRQQAGLGEKSLILETLDFLRSFERGETAKPAAVTYRHRVVLWTILECGSLAAARNPSLRSTRWVYHRISSATQGCAIVRSRFRSLHPWLD